MSESWFSCQLRTVIFIENEGAVDTDLCVHVFKAPDRAAALRRAIRLGGEHNQHYLNGAGEVVEWRFAEVLTLDDLGDEDLEGREVHSEMNVTTKPLPFETTFEPDTSNPGETGVAQVDQPSGD